MDRESFNIHIDIIHLWAKGHEIQLFDSHLNKWMDVEKPQWLPGVKYRVKPKKEFREGDVVSLAQPLKKHNLACPMDKLVVKEHNLEGKLKVYGITYELEAEDFKKVGEVSYSFCI